MINQLNRLCEMIAICNDNFRIIILHRDNHRFAVWQRVYFFTIDNSPYFQEAEKSIISPCNDYIIFCWNNPDFISGGNKKLFGILISPWNCYKSQLTFVIFASLF